MRKLPLLALLVPTLTACGDTIADQGYACLEGSNVTAVEIEGEVAVMVEYEENEPVVFHVILDDCASACLEDEETECSVERDGDVLRVSASATYRESTGNCIQVCHAIEAVCSSGPLEAGTYSVTYAGNEADLVVPSNDFVQVGDGSCNTFEWAESP
jgi:hypothetical protein